MVHFMPFDTNEKKIGYIPIGTAITSYARNYTIRSAQANFDTFCYSDTDSIHLACDISEVVGIKIDSKKLGYWKIETYWDEAIFVRQKTYIEHVTHEDMEEVEKPYYNIKCASMPEGCKKLLQHSMEQDLTHEEIMKYKYEDERVFLNERRYITDFKVGLKVPSALKQRRIYGGVVLYRQTFEMKE